MAETETEEEPSIEEILESIRQIISDDEEGGDAPAEADPPKPADEEPALAGDDSSEAPAEASVEPDFAPAPQEEEVIDLTEEVKDEAESSTDTMDSSDDALDTVEDAPASPEPDITMDDRPDDPVISDAAASASQDALATLAKNLAVERAEDNRLGPVTLEDIVKELLRPMLRDWIDSNLPALIEKLVQKELEKISQRALDD